MHLWFLCLNDYNIDIDIDFSILINIDEYIDKIVVSTNIYVNKEIYKKNNFY